VQSLQKISHNILLDGEIVIIDKQGKPSFQLLQEYSKQPQGTIIYYVFDLLYLDGNDMRQLPLIERKKLLKKVVPPDPHLKYSDHIDTHGIQLFELAQQKQFEGIMAKRKQSHYISSRSNDWQKIKNVQMQEAIICGFTKPNGKRKEFGALILGMYENNDLRYIGHTGSGFDEEKLKEIISLLTPLITPKCPFNNTPKTNAPATWVKPKKVCQIKFSEWTEDGMMRHPVFLGLREDKNPEEVKAEVLATGTNDTPKTKANLEISNLHKVFWPKEGYTKGDLLSYYDRAANYILPYLKNRPESLNRHPNGILADSFYQKDLINHPAWVKTVPIYSKADKKNIHWLVCNDKDTLLYMANLGCIEINPWSSRVNKKDYPDYLIIDLDPNGVDFKEVITTARIIKTMLDKAKIEGFIKTSGKTGLHIFIPLGAKYTFEQTKLFAELLARAASYKLPHTTSVVRDPKKREKKVYIDFLQNRIGQTIAAPYSVRPVPGACVSTPLHWEELHEGLKPTDFTIKNIFKRLASKGDIWKKLLNHKGINMRKSLELIE
jgi:bifunctional non-homologous end joining protein LigD